MGEQILTKAGSVTNDEMANMYLNFNVGNEVYGIEIRHVIQIIGMQEITEMPEMPPEMKGFIRLRGKVIPVISMRVILGKMEEEYSDRTCIIVVQMGEKESGLIVDGIRETLTIDPESISPTPGRREGMDSSYIMGVARLPNEQVAILLHVNKLFSSQEA